VTETEGHTPPARPRWRRVAKRAGFTTLAAILAMGGYLGLLQVDGNVHAVQPGQFYRSAQLDSSQFARVIRQDGIKTILNLRGAHAGAGWYDHELAVSKQFGVTHLDYGISAERMVTPAQIADLVKILRTAPRPILVHCQGGADRSGLVSALYEAVIQGKPAAQADDQLSIRYGHFPWLGSKTIAMDKSFWAYVNTK
jgi:protein tyrosine/serine phosphatase